MKDSKGNVLRRNQRVNVSQSAVSKYDLDANHGVVANADPNPEQLVSVEIEGDIIDLHAKSLTVVPSVLDQLAKEFPDLLSRPHGAAFEWIAEGWGLEGEPTEEQLAAALLMEARTADQDVKQGLSDPSWPNNLRQVAAALILNNPNNRQVMKEMAQQTGHVLIFDPQRANSN